MDYAAALATYTRILALGESNEDIRQRIENGGGEGRESHHVRQAVVQYEQLQQHRRAADEFDVRGEEHPQRSPAVHASGGEASAERDGERHRQQR